MADVEVLDSILLTTKRLLGIEREYTQFDPDIIVNINSALFTLNQVGVGPEDGFIVTGEDETWGEFLESRRDIEAAKTYVYLKVRLVFDPPQMGYLVDAITTQCKELEWRLNVQVDTPDA